MSSQPVMSREDEPRMSGDNASMLKSPSEREDGFFTKYNKLTNAMHVQNTPKFLDYLERVDFNGKGPFVMCDYCCGDGGLSKDMFLQSITILRRKYGERLQINMVYEDLPTLNYKHLFKATQSFGDGVFVSAVGTSFYKQCLPDETVHMGFSSLGFHWMSQKPCTLKNSVFSAMAEDENEVAAFRRQAAEDWSTILSHRSRELRQGGKLFIVMGGTDSGGCSFIKSGNNINYIWETMHDDGLITQDELEHLVFPIYFRTEEEIRAPFNLSDSVVVKNGLRLVSVDWMKNKDPLKEAWKESAASGDTDESRTYANLVTKSFMAWSYEAQAECFHQRTESARILVTDIFYQRYEDKVAADPLWHDLDLPTVILLIEKV